MRFTRHLILLLWIPLLLVSSCSRREDVPVVKIKDRVVTLGMFEKAWNNMSPQYLPETNDLEGLREFLETMINKEILTLKADELGYDKDEFVVQGMEAFKKVGLQAAYLRVKVGHKLKITDEDLRTAHRFYDSKIHFKQILVDTRAEAEEVYNILQENPDFESVCKQYSKGPDAARGGELVDGFYKHFPGNFRQEFVRTKIGDITRPIESHYGYFLIKMVRIDEPRPKPFEAVKDELEEFVTAEKQFLLSNELSDEVRARHGFEWYDENLKIVFELMPPDRRLDDPPDRDTEIYPLLKVRAEDLDKPVVAYSGKVITLKDFSDLYDRANFFQRPKKQYRLGGIRRFLMEIVMNELVEVELATSGIENEPEVAKILKRKREQFMVDKLYDDLVVKQVRIGPDRVRDYYADNKEQFRKSEERRFQVIVAGDKATADRAYEELSTGREFQVVARKHSRDDLVKKSGLAERAIRRGEHAEIDDHGFVLEKIGDVSAPFETSEGWTVLQLLEDSPERLLTVEEAEHDIVHQLKTKEYEERLKTLLGKWKEELPIEVYEKNLKKAKVDEAARHEHG